MQEESVSLHEYVDIIYRKKWLIILVFATVFLTTLYIVRRRPEHYASSSTIYVESLDRSGETAKLRALIGIDTGPGVGRSQEFYLGIFGSRSYRRSVREQIAEYVKTLKMEPAAATAAVDDASSALRLRAGGYEGYFSISVTATSPDIAHAADSIALHTYVEHCRHVAREQSEMMTRFVEEQFDSAASKLRAAEDKLQQFRRRHNLADAGERSSSVLPMEYYRLREGYYSVREERQSLQATVEAAIRSAQLIRNSLDTLSTDPIGRANPRMELSEMLELARKSRTQLQLKKYQEESYERQLRQYEQQHPELTGLGIEYMSLRRERGIYENLVGVLIQRREQLRVQEASETGGIKIIDGASPGRIVPSKSAMTLTIGGVMGLLLGVGLAFAWELLDASVKTAADVTRETDIAVVGTVPRISRPKDSRALRSGRRGVLLTDVSPKGPIAEAYRTLRTSIIYSLGDRPPEVLVVTSPGQSEGKSLTTANLSITCAQMGQKTLVIDADLRRPVQHTYFGKDREGGLSEYIMGHYELEDVAKPTSVENLDLMTAGIAPPNPAPLLASEGMAERVREIVDAYDMVFLDTPPVIAVTDPVILGRLADGVLMVVRCAATPKNAVAHAADIVRTARVNLLGAILNDIDTSRRYGGYHYGYYQGHYGYYGEDADEPETREAS